MLNYKMDAEETEWFKRYYKPPEADKDGRGIGDDLPPEIRDRIVEDPWAGWREQHEAAQTNPNPIVFDGFVEQIAAVKSGYVRKQEMEAKIGEPEY